MVQEVMKEVCVNCQTPYIPMSIPAGLCAAANRHCDTPQLQLTSDFHTAPPHLLPGAASTAGPPHAPTTCARATRHARNPGDHRTGTVA
eukprot:354196-Chlamydomonas_euryale.AAC.17